MLIIFGMKNQKAKEIAAVLQTLPLVNHIEPVQTNIVIFALKPKQDETKFILQMKEKGIYFL